MSFAIRARDKADLLKVLTYLKSRGALLLGNADLTPAQYVRQWPTYLISRYRSDGYVSGYQLSDWRGPTLTLAAFKKELAQFDAPFVKSRPSFLMGFEIEGCVSDEARPLLIQYVCNLYPGIPVDNLIHKDGSIRPKCRGIEIVTPPLPEKKAIERLEWLLGTLSVLSDEGDFQTNGSCGFHVNVSERKSFEWPNVKTRAQFTFEFMKRVDPAKWRKTFGRTRSKYCWWTRGPESVDDIHLPVPTMEAANRFGESTAKARHWAAINTTHLDNGDAANRRLEVRVAGGKDYHRKTDTMREFLLDIRGAMAEAYGSI